MFLQKVWKHQIKNLSDRKHWVFLLHGTWLFVFRATLWWLFYYV